MNKPKGTKDIFGSRMDSRQYVIENIELIANKYNVKRLDTPMFEKKEVYIRSVGESSDIVTKEMYDFTDKGNREMVLRPEGTAGAIRAIVENKLYVNADPLKIYYLGSMFRYEKPQKGRQRQFTQFGIEMLGERSSLIDVEAILMADEILSKFGIKYNLLINSLASKEERAAWRDELKKYFTEHKDELTELSVTRIDQNPLRILDDKVDGQKEVVKNAPKITEFYGEETINYFNSVQTLLKQEGIEFTVEPNLVRGLDYYSDTIFEFVSATSGAAQSTIIGGGRYSDLVKEFDGPDVSGIGFGIGLERLVNDFEELKEFEILNNPDVYVMNVTDDNLYLMNVVNKLRKAGIKSDWSYKKSKKFGKAFEKADKSGAKVFVFFGNKELESGEVRFKVKESGEQFTVKKEDLVEELTKYL